MKIVLFGSERRVGAWGGGRIIDLNRAFASYLREQRGDARAQAHADERVPPRLDNFIALGDGALEDADLAVQHVAESGVGLAAIVPDANSVQLYAPWPGRRIACVGGNYAAHLAGMWSGRPGVTGDLAQITQMAKEEGQWGFWKVPDAVAGPDEEIPFPKRTRRFDYEGEVAIVIGKKGKDISADRIDEFVWGVTLFNDWSIRDGGSQGKPVSYNLAKNFDGCASMGPCIVVGELDHRNVDVETRVNGEVRQSYSTKEMIWPFAEILEYLSRDFTFVPGDVIAGGTSAGTAADRTRGQPAGARSLDFFLQANDVVEVSSPQIGKLSNRVVPAC
jgi:2-keto-4-pentenoate hydratase/2-oxohepta-3-ene-1,7-dioic acid hydratase in catechol pathway